jgi:hypothetical protein
MSRIVHRVRTLCEATCDPHSEVEGNRMLSVRGGPGDNILTDDRAYDEASGTAVLSGTPATVEPLLQHAQ